MKNFQKANSGFTRLTDENLLILTETVLNALGTNDYFPEPEPELSEIETLLADYNAKLAAARRRGSPQDTAEKNESRVLLEDRLAELAFYVNKVAKGNLPVLLSSGFEISKYRKNLIPPAKTRNMRVSDGFNSGQIKLNFESQRGIRLYELRISSEKDEEGQIIWQKKIISLTSSRNNLIESLLPGQYYYFSVRAVNSRGIGDWSDPISWLVR